MSWTMLWLCKYSKPCPKQVQQKDLESKHLRNRPLKQGFDRQIWISQESINQNRRTSQTDITYPSQGGADRQAVISRGKTKIATRSTEREYTTIRIPRFPSRWALRTPFFSYFCFLFCFWTHQEDASGVPPYGGLLQPSTETLDEVRYAACRK
jgi:hypothetical protein